MKGLIRGGALLLAFVLLGWSYMQFRQPPRSEVEAPVQLPVIAVKEIAAVDIRHAGHALHFVYQQGQWQLAGYESRQVDAQALRTLLDDLAAMQIVRIVALGTGHDKKLGLDKAQRIHLQLADASGTVLDAMVGKQGSDLTTTFLRLQSSDAVVSVDRMLRWQLQRTAEGWLKPEPSAKTVGKEGETLTH